MKKTVKTIVTNQPEIITVLKALKPREAINKKVYPDYYKGLAEILDTVYSVYQAREKGTATKEAESEAMAKVTTFLHTLGKANGKYISVCEKSTENGTTTVFFDTLVYHSFKDRIYTTSKVLAGLEAEKVTAGKAKAEAHKKLIENKGTATAYKEAVKKYDDIIAKIEAERNKAGSEAEATTKQSAPLFAKFVTARLKAIVNNRYALSPEEAEALRKIRNKEAKAKRSEAKPEAEAKQGSKKPEAKKPTTAKAKKPEAEAKKDFFPDRADKNPNTTSPEAVKKTA